MSTPGERESETAQEAAAAEQTHHTERDRPPREIRIRIPRMPKASRLALLLVLAVGIGVGIGVLITQSGRTSPASATSPTIEGVWSISRTLTACEHLGNNCRTDPLELRFDNCDDTKCTVTRSNDPNWPTGQEIRREGPDVWVARFEALGLKCRNSLNPGATELRLIVTDTDATSQPAKASILGGTFTHGAPTNPPDCEANPHEAFTLSGTRTGPDQVQSPTANDPKAVQAWYSGGGHKVEVDLAGALNALIGTINANSNQDQYRVSCENVRAAAEAAQAYPTVPDPELQELWSTELSQAARSSTDCLAALQVDDYGLGERAGHEVTASIREANHLHDRFKALGIN